MKVANRMLKAFMLTTISAGALGFSSAAFAQAESPTDEAATATEDEPIIVTATKREQTLQSVPVAVSVTTAAAIERAHESEHLQGARQRTPAIGATSAATQAMPARKIGNDM